MLQSPRFKAAKAELLAAIAESSSKLSALKASPVASEVREAYLSEIKEFSKNRGRDLYYPYLASGLGSGPLVELADGSVKYDMITGIGINFFGHSHPALMSEMIDATSADIMQGNLEPGVEAATLVRLLLSKVGVSSRLSHAWLTTCGTMANEIALKIIRQKKFPCTKVMAFRDCFSGRSTAMQEITDNPKYREGQPTYGEVEYIPFYDPALGLEKSVAQTLSAMKDHFTRYPCRFAALMIEIVQGEGGFNSAPRDFYVRVFEEAKKAGLAIWADEIQTFGRTGELFAYQKFCLNEYIDVATIAKMFQASAVLFSDEFNPRAGLVAGTFSGSSVQLRTARRTLEILCNEGYLGPEGKIEALSAHFVKKLDLLRTGSLKGLLGEIRAIGGMIAFQPLSGTADEVKTVLTRLFDLGVVAFSCGHGPYLVRMLPPLGAMNEKNIDEVCGIVERAILEIGKGS